MFTPLFLSVHSWSLSPGPPQGSQSPAHFLCFTVTQGLTKSLCCPDWAGLVIFMCQPLWLLGPQQPTSLCFWFLKLKDVPYSFTFSFPQPVLRVFCESVISKMNNIKSPLGTQNLVMVGRQESDNQAKKSRNLVEELRGVDSKAQIYIWLPLSSLVLLSPWVKF